MKLPYQPLDKSALITLPTDTTVFHVTKEFGPVTTTDMGRVLTALAHAQLQTRRIKPSIVLPHYTFLNKQQQYPIKKTVDLVITVRDESSGKLVNVNFRVSQFKYDFQPNENYNKLTDQEKLDYASMVHKRPSVMVYLIGFGKRDPFKKVFSARTTSDIYTLDSDMKDQYFAKAASAFLIWKATGKHEQSLFAPLQQKVRLDVVHIHGASNAYVAKHLRDAEEHMGPASPSIVYTMHDSLTELQYTNTLDSVEKFLLAKPEYTFGSKRMFMAPLGIDASDAVTFTNETMAKDLVEGRLDLYFKEIIMLNLLKKTELGQFYGIDNGLVINESMNPFTNPQLVQANLAFPVTFGNYVVDAKQRAKEYLVSQGLLNIDDLDRPLVLHTGDYNPDLARVFNYYNMAFASSQDIYYRAAADFVYLDSDGQLFGSSVLSRTDPETLSLAVQEYNQLKSAPDMHEQHIMRIMSYASGWIQPGEDQGPVYDYMRIYDQIIQHKRRNSKYKFNN